MAKPDFPFSRCEGPAYYRSARYVSRHPLGGRLYLFAWRSLGALIFRLVPVAVLSPSRFQRTVPRSRCFPS